MAERSAVNRMVVGSSPTVPAISYANVAQLAERRLAKAEVVGSWPIIRSSLCGHRIVVIPQPSKLMRWVRVPLAAPSSGNRLVVWRLLWEQE